MTACESARLGSFDNPRARNRQQSYSGRYDETHRNILLKIR